MYTITRHVTAAAAISRTARLAMLGEEFTFIMLLSGTWNAVTLIESTLPLKGAELDLLIVMKRTTARPRPALPATVWVQVEVPDSPHLIERFTALFDSHQMNIAELVSARSLAMKNAIPTHVYSNYRPQPCLAGCVKYRASVQSPLYELHAQGGISVVDYSQHEQDGVE
ncbi:ACT domain-containing protein [Enterobacter hormaechei]